MTSKQGYTCPLKGCSCNKKWFPTLIDLTTHMISSHGEEVIAKRMRVKPAEKPVTNMEKELASAVFPHKIEVIKNLNVTIRDEVDDIESLCDFISRTTNTEATFGFDIEVDLSRADLTRIICQS